MSKSTPEHSITVNRFDDGKKPTMFRTRRFLIAQNKYYLDREGLVPHHHIKQATQRYTDSFHDYPWRAPWYSCKREHERDIYNGEEESMLLSTNYSKRLSNRSYRATSSPTHPEQVPSTVQSPSSEYPPQPTFSIKHILQLEKPDESHSKYTNKPVNCRSPPLSTRYNTQEHILPRTNLYEKKYENETYFKECRSTSCRNCTQLDDITVRTDKNKYISPRHSDYIPLSPNYNKGKSY